MDKPKQVVRRLLKVARHDVAEAKRMLKEFTGLGNAGADIYLSEVQDVWDWVRPCFDDRATTAAKQLGLPTTGKAGRPCATRQRAAGRRPRRGITRRRRAPASGRLTRH